MTRLISRNARYLIRRYVDDSFWHIEDRTSGKLVAVDGSPLCFIEASEAEDWITAHEAPGLGARKETT